jgi:hypothetical protein
MSSLSRRACFKCGNVGHYAGELPVLLGCRQRHYGTAVARRPLHDSCVAQTRAVQHGCGNTMLT